MLQKTAAPGIAVFMAALLTICFFPSCQKADNQAPPANNIATLHLYLTDAPGDYQAAWLDIQKVQVLLTGGDSVGGQGTWVDVPLDHDGPYNLLNFRNGNDTILASVDVPAGTLSKIKMDLGTNNTLVLDNGDSFPLAVPAFITSDAKLIIKNEDASADSAYSLVLDFNVSHSIHGGTLGDSANDYIFVPNVRTFSKDAGGAMEGWAFPPSAITHITAISNAHDTLGTIPNDNGYYKFWGIPEGTYLLKFSADPASGYQSDTMDLIQVTNGNLITLDTMQLYR